MSQVRGAVYSIGLCFGAIGSFLCLVPWCLMMPFTVVPGVSTFRRSYLCLVTRIFFSFAAAMIESVCGIKIFLHSTDSRVLEDRGAFLLANHRTRVDWMFGGWSYATLLHSYPQMSFILKRSLKDVPFFGWCMQIMMYIFLERKRELDLPKIDAVLNYLLGHDKTSSVFIFPEGTDLSESNITKNNKFAADNNLSPLYYVLYPKPAGFITCLNVFKQYPLLSSDGESRSNEDGRVIHNITIAYKDRKYGKRTTDGSMVKGEFPSEIHMLVQRMPISSVPSDPTSAAEWLRALFLEKERQLQSFYNHPSVVNQTATGSTATIDHWPAVIFTSSSIPLLQRLLHWSAVPVYLFTFHLLHTSRWCRWATLLCSVAFIASPVFNGVDNLELKVGWNRTEGSPKKAAE